MALSKVGQKGSKSKIFLKSLVDVSNIKLSNLPNDSDAHTRSQTGGHGVHVRNYFLLCKESLEYNLWSLGSSSSFLAPQYITALFRPEHVSSHVSKQLTCTDKLVKSQTQQNCGCIVYFYVECKIYRQTCFQKKTELYIYSYIYTSRPGKRCFAIQIISREFSSNLCMCDLHIFNNSLCSFNRASSWPTMRLAKNELRLL
jgi:hypothetical protein